MTRRLAIRVWVRDYTRISGRIYGISSRNLRRADHERRSLFRWNADPGSDSVRLPRGQIVAGGFPGRLSRRFTRRCGGSVGGCAQAPVCRCACCLTELTLPEEIGLRVNAGSSHRMTRAATGRVQNPSTAWCGSCPITWITDVGPTSVACGRVGYTSRPVTGVSEVAGRGPGAIGQMRPVTRGPWFAGNRVLAKTRQPLDCTRLTIPRA